MDLKRLAKIQELQRRATNPMDTVASVQAQAQLAHVEVSWLTSQLQQTLTMLEEMVGQKRSGPPFSQTLVSAEIPFAS